MAELNSLFIESRKAGVTRMKKRNMKIDMTPMVDLGFLLITFFVFTTEIMKPNAMNLYMPHDGSSMPTSVSRTMTMLIAGNDKLFYYFGKEEDADKQNQIYQTSYDEKNGIGKVIREKQSILAQNRINKNELMVIIKPSKQSSYKNSVDILDEMIINKITRYALVKPSLSEQNFLSENK